jgi:5-methylcytosine-specific restriction endonuclease McrA
MPASQQAKNSKWYKEKLANGCELCGRKIPTLENNGLEFSHIISKNDNGTNQQFNCLALCPTCSIAFDTVIKPALYKAFTELNIREIPLNWKNGEGRLKEKENEVVL